MEWQPIETAPKDGTIIDVWAKYGDGGERYPNAEFIRGEWRVWGIDGFESPGYVKIDGTATHWMPVPGPPAKPTS
jgi:hypothetical protein